MMRSYPQPRFSVPTGLPTLPLQARPVGGRDRHDSGSRRTSALPVADTRREGYPAWQRARHPAELCDRVAWPPLPEWIAPHPTTGAGWEGALGGCDFRRPGIRFAATILD